MDSLEMEQSFVSSSNISCITVKYAWPLILDSGSGLKEKMERFLKQYSSAQNAGLEWSREIWIFQNMPVVFVAGKHFLL